MNVPVPEIQQWGSTRLFHPRAISLLIGKNWPASSKEGCQLDLRSLRLEHPWGFDRRVPVVRKPDLWLWAKRKKAHVYSKLAY